jgi:hypothetical protein
MAFDYTPTVEAGKEGKLRLMTLSDLDRRTGAARRANDLINAISDDLGGESRLAAAEKQIIQRAALLGTIAEDLETKWLCGEPIDPGTLSAVGNAQRRLFEAIGIRRVPKDITPRLESYLANTPAEEVSP